MKWSEAQVEPTGRFTIIKRSPERLSYSFLPAAIKEVKNE
jgi:hypothetical protein